MLSRGTAPGTESPWLPREWDAADARAAASFVGALLGAIAGGGESCASGSSAAQLITGHVPACGPSWPTSEQGVGVVGTAGRKVQGVPLFQLQGDKSVSPQSARVLLALRVMSNLLEELTGATQECLVSPFWRLPAPQQLPSPPWAFSSLIQQNPAALQKRAASLLLRGCAGAAAGLGGNPVPALLWAPPCCPQPLR